jgi:hypothetical protein
MDEEDEVPLTREALFAGTDDIVLDVRYGVTKPTINSSFHQYV